MATTIIFIIVFAILVFAGCATMTIDSSGNNEESKTVIYVPETNAQGENVTDAEGSTVLIPVTEEDTTQSKKNKKKKNQDENNDNVSENNNADVSQNNNNSNPEQTTAPAKVETNEYEIFRSGNFYAKGSMVDSEGTNPLEIAITEDSIYMLTQFESVDMGIMISDGKTYMIYPAEKCYLKLSSVVMSLIGFDTDEILNTDDLGFSDMLPLSDADLVEDATLNGKACQSYTFNKSDGTFSIVYLNGDRLLGLETKDASGQFVTATYFDSLTGTVPADKSAPATDYEEIGLTDFMKLMANVIQ